MKDTYSAHEPVIPTYFPGNLFRMLQAEDHSDSSLLSDTGLTPEQLANAETLISFNQHKRFILNAIHLTQNAHLGIQFGKQLNVTSLGILGYAAMSCPTLKDALETIVKYFRSRAPLLVLSLHRTHSSMHIEIDETLDFGKIRYFMLSSAICAIENILRYLVGADSIATYANLACSQPENYFQNDHRFDFKVNFNQPINYISFPNQYLSQKLTMADPITEKSTKKICQEMQALMTQQQGMVGKIQQYLLSQDAGFPSMETAAKAFCISSRALRRELQKSATTYQTIVDQIRQQIAVQYLSHSEKPIDEIAEVLGYNDRSNFGRAFKNWTGKSPSDYRKRT